jgi:hypothetical protein
MIEGYNDSPFENEETNYCPVCGEECERDRPMIGCENCTTYCAMCKEWHDNDEEEFFDIEQRINGEWKAVKVCRVTFEQHLETPDILPEFRTTEYSL